MPVAPLDDPAQFINGDEFAVEVSFEGETFLALFDDETQLLAGLGEVDVAESGPSLTAVESVITALGIKSGAELLVNGATYRVKTPRPDGTGITVLPLDKL